MKNEIKLISCEYDKILFEPVYKYSFNFDLNFKLENGGAEFLGFTDDFIQVLQEMLKRSIEEYKGDT